MLALPLLGSQRIDHGVFGVVGRTHPQRRRSSVERRWTSFSVSKIQQGRCIARLFAKLLSLGFQLCYRLVELRLPILTVTSFVGVSSLSASSTTNPPIALA